MRRVKVLSRTCDGKLVINIKPSYSHVSFTNAQGIVLTVSQEEAHEIMIKCDGDICEY